MNRCKGSSQKWLLFLCPKNHYPLKKEVDEAIDIKDIQHLKSLKFDSKDVLIQLMEISGDYLNIIKSLQKIKLDKILSDIRDYFLEVLELIQANTDTFKLSVDLLENRGFKYHTGLTFTVFSENFRGEIAKGGRYKTVTDETATGFTIYTEKLNLKSRSEKNEKLVFIPYLNMDDAQTIIQKGYKVVFGTNSDINFEKEASEMKCEYIWKNNQIVKLRS